MKRNRPLYFFFNFLLLLWIRIEVVDCIIGGTKAGLGQFKYHASLQAYFTKVPEHVCGAAIIGIYHALSAAHCVINDKDKFDTEVFSIVAGVLEVNDVSDNRIEAWVEKIFVPREFVVTNPNPTLKYHETADIVVFKLNEGLKISITENKLKYLKLPYNDIHSDFINEKPIVTGFGIDRLIKNRKINNNEYSSLKYSQTIVLSINQCQSLITTDPIYQKHLCAQMIQSKTSVNQGICTGDSGGPLVLNGNTIIGIITKSPANCNEQKTASVYTRITEYLDFIDKAVKDERSDDIRVAIYRNKRKGFSRTDKLTKVLVEI